MFTEEPQKNSNVAYGHWAGAIASNLEYFHAFL